MKKQFVTLEDAKKIADMLGTIGGGVKPYDEADPSVSGIYIPQYGYFPTPEDGDKKFFHLRFRNGVDGVNAGLVKETMRYAPTAWTSMISQQINQLAEGPQW